MNTEQGLPGSPPTEDEMNSVQDILKRAISAVVGMSQLQADVDMLRQTVAGLQSDSDRLRNHNESLDEALHQSRMTRNELTNKLAQVETDLRNVSVERDELKGTAEFNASLVDKVNAQLSDARLARDNAELRVMELEDELKAANAKLDAARALFAPEPVKPVEVRHIPEPAPEMPKVWEEPEHHEPQVDDPKLPERIYHGQAWNPGYLYDVDKGEYYSEV